MGTRRKQAASQKGEPDLGSPEQMAATEPPEHIPSTRESSPPTSPTLSIAASERRSREHSLAPSEEIVLDSHVPNKPKNAPVAGKRRRPVREAVAPDNAQSLERDVAEISEADDPPPVRKRIRKVQSKKNNSTTSASDHPAPSVVSALSPSPIPPQKLAPSPPPRSQPQTNDRQSDAENNPSPPPAPTGRPRRDRAKNVNYSEDLLDADGKPKQARKLLKSQTISKDVPEESGRGKNVEPRTKRVEAEIVTHAVPPPAPKQSRKTRPRKKVQEEKASLEQISASESEAPTTAPPSPSIAASDTEVASPPTEPSNSRSPPPATIFGVPNQPGFYPHIRIKPLEAKLQSYELSEQELKMTVTEYLMEEAKTIQAQFIHRREKAFERVTEEYEKLVGWIEQQPTE
ncbi:hypothetical protein DFS34DRAFT_300132 [Phlyctochytrium arcticum]|nr:hypothetical protein DFS34DRAFT_300132 [Phlyctochytrium arcticum]